jgi:hypothetical protein
VYWPGRPILGAETPTPPTGPASDLTDEVALGDPGADVTSGRADRPFVALTFHGSGDPTVTTQVRSLASGALAGLAAQGLTPVPVSRLLTLTS